MCGSDFPLVSALSGVTNRSWILLIRTCRCGHMIRCSLFLLSSRCDQNGYYRVAHGTGVVPNEIQFPCRTLVACLVRIPPGPPRGSTNTVCRTAGGAPPQQGMSHHGPLVHATPWPEAIAVPTGGVAKGQAPSDHLQKHQRNRSARCACCCGEHGFGTGGHHQTYAPMDSLHPLIEVASDNANGTESRCRKHTVPTG